MAMMFISPPTYPKPPACRGQASVVEPCARSILLLPPCRQVHEGMMERGAYPSPYNYYNFPKVGGLGILGRGGDIRRNNGRRGTREYKFRES